MKIAILGWGSLLWDGQIDFDKQHRDWLFDGPELKLEFSRISTSRKGALTLVIDPYNGALCRVAYAFSKRLDPADAICDLRSREKTTLSKIGFYFCDGSQKQSRNSEAFNTISSWAVQHAIDVVIWTDLESNFKIKFSVESAIQHINNLDVEGKAKAAEYVWRAPNFVKTPLRTVLEENLFFQKYSSKD